MAGIMVLNGRLSDSRDIRNFTNGIGYSFLKKWIVIMPNWRKFQKKNILSSL